MIDIAPIQPGWSQPSPRQTVCFGIPAAQAVHEFHEERNCQRAVLVTTRSLSQDGGLAAGLAAELGSLHLATVSNIAAHSPRDDVARIATALRDCDAVITLGGGSVCDTTKVARLCAANAVYELDDVHDWLDALQSGSIARVIPPAVPFTAIPTTLSAAEYLPLAGITDMRHGRKAPVRHQDLAPDLVILDGKMGTRTPSRLWAGTGARAIDHAVESWCAVNATAFSDATALKALELLIPGLKRSISQPDDVSARLACLVGSWLSTKGAVAGVDVGASHGIGHALGGVTGMAHGETSAVMLPHVLAFNAAVNGARQQELAYRLALGDMPLEETIRELFLSLGLPGRLRDAGVARTDLTTVAAAAMDDHWTASNPRRIDTESVVRRLLQRAW